MDGWRLDGEIPLDGGIRIMPKSIFWENRYDSHVILSAEGLSSNRSLTEHWTIMSCTWNHFKCQWEGRDDELIPEIHKKMQVPRQTRRRWVQVTVMEGSTSLEGHHCGNQDPRGVHDYGSPFLHLGVQGRQTSLGTYGRPYGLPLGITLGRRTKDMYCENIFTSQIRLDNLLQTKA